MRRRSLLPVAPNAEEEEAAAVVVVEDLAVVEAEEVIEEEKAEVAVAIEAVLLPVLPELLMMPS
jgi:hypothetical protein